MNYQSLILLVIIIVPCIRFSDLVSANDKAFTGLHGYWVPEGPHLPAHAGSILDKLSVSDVIRAPNVDPDSLFIPSLALKLGGTDCQEASARKALI